MKTISLDDEAYNLLRGAKLSPRDSFSDVVKRIFGVRPPISNSAGTWAEFSEERLQRLMRERLAAFGTTGE
jgi:predicted CopG family antitoxin